MLLLRRPWTLHRWRRRKLMLVVSRRVCMLGIQSSLSKVSRSTAFMVMKSTFWVGRKMAKSTAMGAKGGSYSLVVYLRYLCPSPCSKNCCSCRCYLQPTKTLGIIIKVINSPSSVTESAYVVHWYHLLYNYYVT